MYGIDCRIRRLRPLVDLTRGLVVWVCLRVGMKLLGVLLFLALVATGEVSGWVLVALLMVWPAWRILLALIEV